jgi:hypothetical protein
MNALFIVTLVYLMLGLLAFLLTIAWEGNFFIKYVVKQFNTVNDFNKFMLFYWLIPIIISIIIIIIL